MPGRRKGRGKGVLRRACRGEGEVRVRRGQEGEGDEWGRVHVERIAYLTCAPAITNEEHYGRRTTKTYSG